MAVNPTLTVRFNHRPNTPAASGLSTNNPTTHCATTPASAPHVNVTPNGGIKLLARVGDPDGDQVRVTYDFRPLNGSPVANPTTGLAAGGTFAVTIKPPALRNGTTYVWHVQVTDTVGDKSAVSTWCYLVEDSLAPSPPVVTSDDYPTDAYAGFSGRDGLFTISPGADGGTDIARYYYGFDQPTPTTQATPDGPTVPLSLRLVPHGYGPHDLWVRSEDTAGNRSAPIPYHFYVGSPTDTSGYWKFDEGAGSTAQSTVENNPASAGPTATLSPTGASWVPGHTGTAIRLDGATGYVTEDTSVTSPIEGYTVSA